VKEGDVRKKEADQLKCLEGKDGNKSAQTGMLQQDSREKEARQRSVSRGILKRKETECQILGVLKGMEKGRSEE